MGIKNGTYYRHIILVELLDEKFEHYFLRTVAGIIIQYDLLVLHIWWQSSVIKYDSLHWVPRIYKVILQATIWIPCIQNWE